MELRHLGSQSPLVDSSTVLDTAVPGGAVLAVRAHEGREAEAECGPVSDPISQNARSFAVCFSDEKGGGNG